MELFLSYSFYYIKLLAVLFVMAGLVFPGLRMYLSSVWIPAPLADVQDVSSFFLHCLLPQVASLSAMALLAINYGSLAYLFIFLGAGIGFPEQAIYPALGIK